MDVSGSTVLVTGASSGIGEATARLVARKGGHPVLLARSADKLAVLVEEIGSGARAYPVDCGDREAVVQTLATVKQEAGVPDALVNNAGAGRMLFFDETPPEEFEQMMSAPYFAAVNVTRALVPDMIERGSGVIVNVNTPAAFAPWPASAGYASTRWALRGFNETLRADLRGTGIKVCQVVPGEVTSNYFANNPGSEETIPRISRMIGKVTPEQVADSIVHTIERERRIVFLPLMLRMLMFQTRVLPRLTEELLARTGRRRPA